ncbi:MAG: HlyD family type I secretion periplasmic adaptor subunit [Gammaproteobacteria bacterium]|nr:HlyD family type I secretion periplasmic adaptor subunit [Gammaproteobacteria bacterium]
MHMREEYEFLPAALEIEETPPNTVGRWILWAIMTFIVLAIVWASFSEVEIVATAQGKIIASGRDKIIQPLEAGVVRAIHVRDGQHVKQGDLIIELDPTTSGADVQRVESDLVNARLDAWRWGLLAKLVGKKEAPGTERPAIASNATIQEEAPESTGIEKATLEQRATQIAMLRRQLEESTARIAALDEALTQHRAELATAKIMTKKLSATLPLVTQRAASLRTLKEQSLAPEQDYLTLEQQRLEQLHDLDAQRSRVQETESAISSVLKQKQVLQAEFVRNAMEQFSIARNTARALEQDLVKADQRRALQQLTAPVDGVVQQLVVNTVGGVVTPAQPLMVIVPEGQTLEAEALVQNKDIGFVEDGQNAIVKVDTFPFTKYGTLAGTIQHVSNDAIEDKQQGFVYAARVTLAQSAIHVGEKLVNLAPGMTVTVEVQTGKRRLIEYFLSPLMRYGAESARER